MSWWWHYEVGDIDIWEITLALISTLARELVYAAFSICCQGHLISCSNVKQWISWKPDCWEGATVWLILCLARGHQLPLSWVTTQKYCEHNYILFCFQLNCLLGACPGKLKRINFRGIFPSLEELTMCRLCGIHSPWWVETIKRRYLVEASWVSSLASLSWCQYHH